MTLEIEKELMKDHKKISQLMIKIESILEKKSKGDKEVLFNELNEELTAHSKAEEKTFYENLNVEEEEEGEMFEKSETILDDDDGQRIKDDFLEKKEKIIASL